MFGIVTPISIWKNAPIRDTIILWSAVIAGIGLLALLVRHTTIYKFGTDTITENILFGNSSFYKENVCQTIRTHGIKTIEQKLRENKSTKEIIPIYTNG